ncbi:MAG: DNA cytosine methyltransferase [Aestuariivirga sp.]|uniref:DNA cytosine methyltransferase n=1 Tax=Aestuariivirga sp. TaxID=2650926 RepID=UPI0025BC46B7|nr:DNA cytosine methyltransferase [Aestuariivirga sp.]MCA3560237.1 DNA cytosine methyltransferase [Aestuariivirga sp.]
MGAKGRQPAFIDAFAGCGGLSLGLMQAGLKGLFAVEKDNFAFATLRHNLIDGDGTNKFDWPKWLEQQPKAIEDLLVEHQDALVALRGEVDVLAGGPPCQGFSSAGRRRSDDPRNRLFKSYVELVRLVEPRIVLMENVKGFTLSFGGQEGVDNYASSLRNLLSDRYRVHERLLDLSRFGVPQQRIRYILIALHPSCGDVDPFKIIEERMASFLRSQRLQAPVSSWSAISDLETGKVGVQPSTDTPGFKETLPAMRITSYQKLMGEGAEGVTDLRLARHASEIARRFAEIIESCHAEGRLNTSIGAETRQRYGLKKLALRVLDPDRPSPTITSMPDDLLHYSEPRTLTVRENARLQSFPDWFAFKGKYTTGGHRRRLEVPRFTQVANAVPPLAACAIGEALLAIMKMPVAKNKPLASRKARVEQPELITQF